LEQITQILDQLESSDPAAAKELLPLVYEELRKLAAAKLSNERSDHTLQATALVHEAWLRITNDQEFSWNSRGHFFGAAAEAMRRILIDHARAGQTAKRGGQYKRNLLESWNHPASQNPEKLLNLDEALCELEDKHPTKAKLVKLRFFTGMTVKEAASTIGISTATAERHWAFARAWLHAQLE
jgi:RNA polymerase sigma factor (TIGR02999 family)